MARKPYTDAAGNELNIGTMTTRQLRGYIYDKAREAQERLNTVNLEDTSRAFRDAARYITDRSGKVMLSTSNMTKAELKERAYDLRQFASLDTQSGFAQSIEWQQNKEKYKSFIRTQLEDPLFRDDFMRNLTKKGLEQYEQYRRGEIELKDITGISKKGFQEYRNYVSFLSNISTIVESYGYETIKQYAVESKNDPQRARVIERLLFKVYNERQEGWTQKQLAERFQLALEEYDKKQTASAKLTQSKPAVSGKKARKSSSGTIKTKSAGKMRTHGTVREKLT